MSDAREQIEPGMERPPTGGVIGVREPERYAEIIDRRARKDATRQGRSLQVRQSRMGRETHQDRDAGEADRQEGVCKPGAPVEPEAPKEPGAPVEPEAPEEP